MPAAATAAMPHSPPASSPTTSLQSPDAGGSPAHAAAPAEASAAAESDSHPAQPLAGTADGSRGAVVAATETVSEPQPQPSASALDFRPAAVQVVYYSQACNFEMAAVPGERTAPGNVAVCQPPDSSVDFRSAVLGADALYRRLFPGEILFPGGGAADVGTAEEEDLSDDEALNLLDII